MLSSNEVVIASAGAGKTRRLVDEALSDPTSRVLIVTYTRKNFDELESRLWNATRGAKHGVRILTWFEFLLRECIKPYQSFKTTILSIKSINFDGKRLRYARKARFGEFYADSQNNLYQDSVSDLACALDNTSEGMVIGRLSECYDAIFIDELQDLAGPDLDFLEKLFASEMRILCVGDPRQSVYVTNTSARNKQFRRTDLLAWIDAKKKTYSLEVSEQTVNFRCNQAICDFADRLYPEYPRTLSENVTQVAAFGVHLVAEADLASYREAFSPQELRYDRKSKSAPISALNMGEVKGMAFDRVLIHPTSTMVDAIMRGVELSPVTRAKFYVAVTRARHSVGIVCSESASGEGLSYWIVPST
jgi:hypothetical protein|nr:UvrD-helicase domain-containing protein [Ferrimicrobium acidiphilum]